MTKIIMLTIAVRAADRASWEVSTRVDGSQCSFSGWVQKLSSSLSSSSLSSSSWWPWWWVGCSWWDQSKCSCTRWAFPHLNCTAFSLNPTISAAVCNATIQVNLVDTYYASISLGIFAQCSVLLLPSSKWNVEKNPPLSSCRMVEAVLPENQFLPILISIHMPARLSYPNWGPLWRCLTATHPVKVLCLQKIKLSGTAVILSLRAVFVWFLYGHQDLVVNL